MADRALMVVLLAVVLGLGSLVAKPYVQRAAHDQAARVSAALGGPESASTAPVALGAPVCLPGRRGAPGAP